MKPKLRNKKHQANWQTQPIKEIASFSKGQGYSKSDLTVEGEPIILYGQMYTRYKTIITEAHTFVKTKKGNVISKGGEIIVPASGETPEDIAIASVVSKPGILLGGDINVIDVDREKIDSAFAALAITYSKTHDELSSMAQGKSVVHLQNSSICKAHLSFPELNEQNDIVALISKVDAQIESIDFELEKLRQLKAASLQAMFPRDGETAPLLRFKGFEGEWKNVKLGDIGTTYSGLTGKGKDDFGVGDARFITFLNVLNNPVINPDEFKVVNVAASERQNKARKGDLFFNTSSETPEEVGMCSVLTKEYENLYLNSFCFGFRLTDENHSPLFLAYLMRSGLGRKMMKVLAQGATRYNLSKTNFLNSTVLLPSSFEEQTKIAAFFLNLDKQINLAEKKLERLKQIKASCLDLMFV